MNRKGRRLAASRERHFEGTRTGSARAGTPDITGLLSEAKRLHDSARFSEAAILCERVLTGDPSNAEALLIRGSAASHLGDAGAARRYLAQAVARRPENPRAWIVLSSHLFQAGETQAALEACEEALRVSPNFPAAHAALGSILASKREFERAEAAYRRALALQPDFVDAEINLGSALFYQGRLDEAVAANRRALALNPRHIHAYRNLAASLRALGSFEEALAVYRQAVRIAPDFAEAHRDEGLLLLLLGRFEEGWRKYEWRWRALTIGANPIRGPRWSGEPLGGRTIVLQAEQGIGDTLQFIRYAPLVAQSGGAVILNLPASLVRLSGSAIAAAGRTVMLSDPLPAFDRYAPLLSLPRMLGTTLDRIPAHTPYLAAPPDCVARWQREFSGGGGMRIGVAWAGNPAHENDHNRSIAFSRLFPLFGNRRVCWYSLQVGERAADVRTAAEFGIVDLSTRLTDFAETAGAINALDLVITVDTAVAHLAGALGRPVWLLLPHVPDWRWLLARDDSPWYPSMRLFRQARRNAWPEVIANVERALSLAIDYGCPATQAAAP
jgi:tetratricopeptide (TPR) repeat protein